MKYRKNILYMATALLIGLLMGANAHAKPGCVYEPIDIDKYGGDSFMNPKTYISTRGRLNVELKVSYAQHLIAGCDTRLRSYNGELVGPTLVVRPGDTLNVDLKNMLPDDQYSQHSFNTTNFHSHGFHVSPAGNSDNVLLRIKPGQNFKIEIKVPRDHPPGTFWYHAHVHGSTAAQVSSGMAGALIVRGGLDRVEQIRNAKQKVFVFQQISYDENGEIENFDVFGPGVWETLQRHVTINGQIVPVITMRPGEVQRWRFVHAGVRNPLFVRLQGHKLHEIATDGIALGKLDSWDKVELHPGYRSDVLVQARYLAFPGQSEYLLYDDSDPGGAIENKHILAKVKITGPPVAMSLPASDSLAPLLPFKDIEDNELTGYQDMRFSIVLQGGVPVFTVNERSFDLNYKRVLKLGDVEQWNLSVSPESLAPVHPFHIHVNPFQMTRIGPDGAPEKVWKDTVAVIQGQDLIVRSRYSDYIGKFVLHCHILDHEDHGMMELVEIVNP